MAQIYFACFIFFTFLNIITAKTLSVVIDTTVSMEKELEVVKRHFPTIIRDNDRRLDFENFALVPFTDPGIETPLLTPNPHELLEAVYNLTASGGYDCPEDSLAGIRKGLEISQPDSYIYVFTDAYAKYDRDFNKIEELCRSTRSQVIIFLSGFCPPVDLKNEGNSDIYYEIAKVCSGAVFRLEESHLRKAFRYIGEMIRTDYNEVLNHAEANGYKQFTFTVDSFTSDLLLVVAGEYPVLQIVDSAGNSPYTEKIVDTSQSMVVHVSNLQPGLYRASARCQGPTYITFYKRNRMPFQYGFSTRFPNSLSETSLRPIPGWTNYIFIKLHDNYNIRIDSLELEYVKANEKKPLEIRENGNQKGCYYATVFVTPAKPFKMAIVGKNLATSEDVTGTTKVINAQVQVQAPKWLAPTTEIIPPDSNFIDYGANATLACKVSGYPKPHVWWEDDMWNILPSESTLLEIPSTYISYVNIVGMANNFTLYCKSNNSIGSHETSIELYVNRTFTLDVTKQPKDTTIEYGKSGKLYCEADAYPRAEIKWYHNDTSIEYSDNIQQHANDASIEIKNMTLADIGTYTCEVSNTVETKTLKAYLSVSGLDKPEVSVPITEVIKNPGDWIGLECSIDKGNPIPIVSWEYKSEDDYDFNDKMPKDVFVEGNKLKIPAAKMEHTGLYRCIARNIVGEDSADITLYIQYAPKITNGVSETLNIMEGESVELPCEVDAVPMATVRWELTQDDVIVPFNDRHSTNDDNTHRFFASWNDSGNYNCIAENTVGKTEKTVTVNVLVSPYIQPPEFKNLTVLAGDNLNLDCNVLYGNPAPKTRWEFIAVHSPSKVLSRGLSNNILYLRKISKADEGVYICVAENSVGNDRIRIKLKIN